MQKQSHPLWHHHFECLTLTLHCGGRFSRYLAVAMCLSICVCGPPLQGESSGQKEALTLRTEKPPKGNVDPSGKYISTSQDSGVRGKVLTADETRMKLLENLKLQPIGEGKFKIGKVILDKKMRTVSFPVKVNMDHHTVEYVLVTEQGKAHESIFTTTVTPTQIHLACVLLGMKALPSKDWPQNASSIPATQRVSVEVTWPTNGPPKRITLHQFILKSPGGNAEIKGSIKGATKGGAERKPLALAKGDWLYNGSHFSGGAFSAEREGSIISIIADGSALVNGLREGHENDKIHIPNQAILPAKGRQLTMIFTLPEPT